MLPPQRWLLEKLPFALPQPRIMAIKCRKEKSSNAVVLMGLKEGWYDGGSIAFAVLLVVTVTAISDYRQSLQFHIQNEDKRNIKVEEVVRGGRRTEVFIFDLVVGDVVPLKIGDQILAHGILISGHSLSVDESSMTWESKHVHKDQKTVLYLDAR